jgi:hypothetical protein
VHTARNRVYQESAVRTVVKRQSAVLLSLALAACGVPAPKPPAAPTAPGPAAPAGRAPGHTAPAAGTRYRIDPAQSELRVLVYRAGPMASLGHNHVVSTHSVQGWAVFDGDAAAAAFALTAPVGDFVVDDPRLRAEEGADFAEEVGDEARSGTLHNMLGPAVLNAANFPALEIKSVSVSAAAGRLRARVVFDVAGHASTIVVPFVLDVSPRRVAASGELSLSQSSIGLTPFSVFLGALKVQDELKVKFKFVAVSGGA